MDEKSGLKNSSFGPDLHVIFPPQWSPFQPFLSTPSLKAYLESKGHVIEQSDWNVAFYKYFISRERLPLALRRLRHYIHALPSEYEGYKARSVFSLAVLEMHEVLYNKVQRLKDPQIIADLAQFKECVDALQRLLRAFSAAEPVIEVSTSIFSAQGALTSLDSLSQFTESQRENPFIEFFEQKTKQLVTPRYFGVSIIGSEQVVPGLTLCRTLKKQFPGVPVIIGGSVFSRLLDKDPLVKALFGTFFDYICRYEGEQPMDAFLSANDPSTEEPPNLAFLNNDRIITTPLCEPLKMEKIPTPDFSGLLLTDYFAPELVLPLLTTRGCYWGKCAFCYHGMIYQNRYRMRQPDLIAKDVHDLHQRHGVRHFAFNDEALPPKLFKLLPNVIPPGQFLFSGLFKIEAFYEASDFRRMHDIGFRSLYVGLETASERVQRHMQKNNQQGTMLKNFRDAHNAGIWNHAFVFFGFPTETEKEAEETVRFLLEHADIIHSEGTGTFSLEYNAPVFLNSTVYGVSRLYQKPNKILELYYDYEVDTGLDFARAEDWVNKFTTLKKERGLYQNGRWIPREYLLLLLGQHSVERLRQEVAMVEAKEATLPNLLCWFRSTIVTGKENKNTKYFVVSLKTGKVFETNKDAIIVLGLLDQDSSIETAVEVFPGLAPLANINTEILSSSKQSTC